jgi:hypothetical protein
MTDVNEKNGNGVSCKIIHRKCLLKITVTKHYLYDEMIHIVICCDYWG